MRLIVLNLCNADLIGDWLITHSLHVYCHDSSVFQALKTNVYFSIFRNTISSFRLVAEISNFAADRGVSEKSRSWTTVDWSIRSIVPIQMLRIRFSTETRSIGRSTIRSPITHWWNYCAKIALIVRWNRHETRSVLEYANNDSVDYNVLYLLARRPHDQPLVRANNGIVRELTIW